MAITLPVATPSTPSAGNSSASDESSNSPSNMPLGSPASSDHSNNNGTNQIPQQNAGVAQMKRKPSRRANTAERRATHNAVERQRRETLNGRFLVCSLVSVDTFEMFLNCSLTACRIWPLCCPISRKSAVPQNRQSSTLPSLIFTLLGGIVNLLPVS